MPRLQPRTLARIAGFYVAAEENSGLILEVSEPKKVPLRHIEKHGLGS